MSTKSFLVFILLTTWNLSVLTAAETNQVYWELFELAAEQKWPTANDQPTEASIASAMAMPQLPNRYSSEAIVVDRQAPFVLRLTATLQLPIGDYELLARAMNQARLKIDEKVVAKLEFKLKYSDGHNQVPKLSAIQGIRQLAPGHDEQVVPFTSDGEPHQIIIEALVGGKKKRPETGELSVAIRSKTDVSSQFVLIAPSWQPPGYNLRTRQDGLPGFPFVDPNWEEFVDSESVRISEMNKQRRNDVDKTKSYWSRRHAAAQEHIASLEPIAVPESDSIRLHHEIDHFVFSQITEPAQIQFINDLAFLRRLALDTVGVVPTLEEANWYLDLPKDSRREQAIERFVTDPRWADHWVAYWQDVLAENPGILKPKLNNTGPFRWWIYESFLDNKPVDRFVTELIMMRGSKYAGGPAGFSMATQNDVPMAAKAHVIGQAFLGVQMKCARCHDAPNHDLHQKDLFHLAAMLKRQSQKVPETSSIPTKGIDLEALAVQVTLQPGSDVDPIWPFANLLKIDFHSIPQDLLKRPDDTREQLALLVTSHINDRFAEVVVNRLWHRYFGRGIVDSVDDWESATNHSPPLLTYLARKLVANRYDLKYIAKSIFRSRAYQTDTRHFARSPLLPHRRRLTAEQIVDSLFTISGKSFESEMLNLDVDGQRPVSSFLNLGFPKRSWEFTSLSNERDRPALAMPRAQGIVDLLQTFGWRDSRQDPITERESEPTLQQPGMIGNGVVAQRSITLSEDSHFTSMCRSASSIDSLVNNLFTQVLTRYPNAREMKDMRAYLADGFETRLTNAKPQRKHRKRHAVSWSNHLNEEATRIKLEIEQQVRDGDLPTVTLSSDWRKRVEDVLWALVNSPEFVFVP